MLLLVSTRTNPASSAGFKPSIPQLNLACSGWIANSPSMLKIHAQSHLLARERDWISVYPTYFLRSAESAANWSRICLASSFPQYLIIAILAQDLAFTGFLFDPCMVRSFFFNAGNSLLPSDLGARILCAVLASRPASYQFLAPNSHSQETA